MPEVSNCELYKLESKVEEMETVAKRMREQLERIKAGTTSFLDDEPNIPYDFEEPRT